MVDIIRFFGIFTESRVKKEQTDKLFNRVYFEMSFNVRDPREFIYMYCIVKGLKYADAERLIGQYIADADTSEPDDATIPSQSINNAMEGFSDESELLDYIKELKHNFSLSNTAAKKRRQDTLKILKGSEGDDGLALREAILHGSGDGAYADMKAALLEVYKGFNPHSASFVVAIIKGMNYAGNKGNEETALLRKLFKQPELRSQFPNNESIEDPDPTVYALRRDIIFLCFYWFWASQRDENDKYDSGGYGKFCAYMDSVLNTCGMPRLYYRNPYDCLFLYCSLRNSEDYEPIQVFRSIIAPEDSDEDE